MTLVLSKTGGALTLLNQLPADTDADTYIAAVEGATGDNQALEADVKFAIKNFVLCCKQDGIWDAMKACCILAGARTLNGALKPLKGTAPTNNNFVSGDYNRKTGLVGDGSTKYLNSNRNNNADPQNSKHISVYAQQAGVTLTQTYIGGSIDTWIARDPDALYNRINQAGSVIQAGFQGRTGFIGASRPSSSTIVTRSNNTSPSAHSSTSVTPTNELLSVFRKSDNTQYSNARLSFYSIGESLDLALLDARVTDLMNALGAAIP